MADNVLASFLVALGFEVNRSSQQSATSSLASFEKAVKDSEARIEQAKAAGAKASVRYALEIEAAQAREALETAKATKKIEEVEAQKAREHARGADKFTENEKRKNKAQAEATAFAIAKYQLLISAIQSAARATSDAVTTAVTSFNQIYYVSARTNSSVSSLKSFGYAAEQTGGSFAGAVSAVESFQQAMRTNPGVRDYVRNQLHVDKNLDGTEQTLQAVERLNEMYKDNPHVAQAWATTHLGIPLDVFNQLSRYGKEIRQQVADRKAFYESIGLDETKASEDSKRFSQALGSVMMMVGGLRDKLVTALIPAVEGLITKFRDWIAANPKQIDEVITSIAKGVSDFAIAAGKVDWGALFKGLVDFAKGVNDAVQGMGGWKVVAEAVFALWIGDKVVKVLASIAAIRSALVLGEGSLLAALLRVASPIAIGAVATGHGYQTPEQAAKDPEQAELQREGIDRRGRVREAIGGAWRGVKRFFGGGDAEAAEGGAGIYTRARRAARGDRSEGVAANPGAYKDVLDHIARSEGTANREGGGYNTSLDFGKWLPGGKETDLKGKTLDEIDALQTGMLAQPENRAKYGNGQGSSAIGRYQIVRKTLRGLRDDLGLKGTEVFDEKMQDRLGAELARRRGADAAGLRQEWASLVGANNATAVALMQKVDPKASTMPLDRPSTQVGGNVPAVNGAGGVDQSQGGAQHRRESISDVLQRQLVAAGTAAGVSAEVFSGGQDPDHQYGSTRHNHGNAADLKLYRMEDGKKRYLSMLNDADRAVMEKFVRASVAAGATGVGAHPNYMGPEAIHVGGGAPAAWGSDKTSATAPEWLARAHRQGLEDRKAGAAADSVKAAAQAVKATADSIVVPKPAPVEPKDPSPPQPDMRQPNRSIVVPPMNPSGFDPNRIDPRDLMKPAAPLGANPVTNDNRSSTSKSVTQNITNHVKVDGSGSPREHGRIMESSLSRVHGLALANVQSAVA